MRNKIEHISCPEPNYISDPKEKNVYITEELKKLTLYRQSKMSKSSCPPPDFEIAEKHVCINTLMKVSR